MKTIWLAGAALMIGASVYGIINYQKTSNKKEFKNLYTDKPAVDPTVNKGQVTVPDTKTSTAVPANNKHTGLGSDKPAKDVKTTVSSEKSVTQHDDKPVVHKRRFSPRLFSRAPLDEKYIEPPVSTDTTKKN
jgi:hypothetical protein